MKLQLSVRTYLYLTIIFMAGFGLALSITIGNVYRDSTLKGHQELLSDLVTRQAAQLIELLERDATDLAFSLQSESAFIEQIQAGSKDSIKALLDQQYQRQFAEDGIIKLLGLAVFDQKFIRLASSRKEKDTDVDNMVCHSAVSAAAKGVF